jgi:hypothetical protein
VALEIVLKEFAVESLTIATAPRLSIFAVLTLTALTGLPANAADPPAYMRTISGAVDSTPAECPAGTG